MSNLKTTKNMEYLLYGKKTNELSKAEWKFYNEDLHDLNNCDKCNIILHTSQELYWSQDWDIYFQGYDSLCFECMDNLNN